MSQLKLFSSNIYNPYNYNSNASAGITPTHNQKNSNTSANLYLNHSRYNNNPKTNSHVVTNTKTNPTTSNNPYLNSNTKEQANINSNLNAKIASSLESCDFNSSLKKEKQVKFSDNYLFINYDDKKLITVYNMKDEYGGIVKKPYKSFKKNQKQKFNSKGILKPFTPLTDEIDEVS